MILKKELKAHEKLQPIRKLSEFIGVNNTTVVKAYELLENEGYIYKVIGSGTFVSSRNKNEDIKIEKDGKDFMDGFADGFMKGAISGAITGAFIGKGVGTTLAKRAAQKAACRNSFFRLI